MRSGPPGVTVINVQLITRKKKNREKNGDEYICRNEEQQS